MKAVFLTAGAAGMYCGSCMHDNSLARAMRQIEVDCVLQPVYTPIRTDAGSVANKNVFFGGIHIYLLQQMPWLKVLPKPMLRALDWPPLIRLATRRASSTDAGKLGELSVSMLQGTSGRQAAEVQRIVNWLSNDMKPDAVLFSNLLIGGAIPQMRSALPNCNIAVLLQGDDIFLDHLPEPSKGKAIRLCSNLVRHVDLFVTHSQFYAEKMARMLSIPDSKMKVTPLSIDLSPFDGESPVKSDDQFGLGYMARIAPEKGLHHLVDAFIKLACQPEHQDLHLHVAGWLGESNQTYFDSLVDRVATAQLASRFHHHGSPQLDEKVQLLKSLDVVSVPTDYQEPKGIFVLESLAAGVPVVQPRHGAFPEMIESTGGGLLFPPGEIDALCDAISRMKSDDGLRQKHASQGLDAVRQKHSIEKAALDMRDLLFGSVD